MKILFIYSLIFICFSCQKSELIPENMVYFPPGTYKMGSKLSPDEIQEKYGYEFTKSVKDNWKIERPYHQIQIEKAFYISKYEVTNAEFQLFINETKYQTDAEKGNNSYSYSNEGVWSEIDSLNWKNPGLWKIQPDYPVVLVSWNDANAYTKWYSQKTGLKYRLPTEQEWEYACRAGSEDNFTWGDDPKMGKGFINALDSYFGFDDGYKYVAPVGSFKPNNKGLHDMLGNVWEWCSSKYVKQYPISSNTPEAQEYVDRGGGWDAPPFNARISNRGAADSKFNTTNLGFRLVLELE